MRARRSRRRVGHAARPFGMDDHDEMTGALPWADIEEQSAMADAVTRALVNALAPGPRDDWTVTSRPPSGPPLLPPITVQISHVEQAHHAVLRERYAELAVQRGHMRRYGR